MQCLGKRHGKRIFDKWNCVLVAQEETGSNIPIYIFAESLPSGPGSERFMNPLECLCL